MRDDSRDRISTTVDNLMRRGLLRGAHDCTYQTMSAIAWRATLNWSEQKAPRPLSPAGSATSARPASPQRLVRNRFVDAQVQVGFEKQQHVNCGRRFGSFPNHLEYLGNDQFLGGTYPHPGSLASERVNHKAPRVDGKHFIRRGPDHFSDLLQAPLGGSVDHRYGGKAVFARRRRDTWVVERKSGSTYPKAGYRKIDRLSAHAASVTLEELRAPREQAALNRAGPPLRIVGPRGDGAPPLTE
jgi:hypothetical protein